MEIRFHNPYRHWFKGLLVELAFIAGFMLFAAACALVAAWAA